MVRFPNGSTSAPPVSSSFGPRSGGGGASTNHKGVDLVGFDQVRSIAPGRVVVVGTPSGWGGGGKQVWVQHEGFFSKYMHLASWSVSVGQNVGEGDYLGAMDTTGTATGKNLHLEVTLGQVHYSNSGQINPIPFIFERISAAGPTANARTRKLQEDLRKLGYEISVDGIYGPQTTGAVRDFQGKNGLEVDGIAGPKTLAKIAERLAAPVGRNATSRPTAEIQKLVGANPDGIYGPATTAKVIEWQRANGLEPDGVWGPLSDAKGFPKPVQSAPLNVDGVWGSSTTTAIQTVLGVQPVDGIRGEDTIRAIQRAVGAEPDGVWGPSTAKHLQAAVGLTGADIDGDFGPKSVRALQTHLNAGRPLVPVEFDEAATPTVPTPPAVPVSPDNPRGLMTYTPVYPGASHGLVAPLGDGLRSFKGDTLVEPIIDTAAIHRTGGDHDDLDWFSYKNPRSSCPNWYIRKSGQVIELIPPKRKPALTGADWNYRTWGVELQGAGDGTPEQFEALARIMAWCVAQGDRIDGIRSGYSLDRNRNLGHREMLPGSTECPGDWWVDRIPALIERAAAIVAAEYTPEPPEPETVEVRIERMRAIVEQLEAAVAEIRGILGDES